MQNNKKMQRKRVVTLCWRINRQGLPINTLGSNAYNQVHDFMKKPVDIVQRKPDGQYLNNLVGPGDTDN